MERLIQDYKKIKFSKRKLIEVILKGFGIIGAISYLFFDNIFLTICLSPYIIYYIKKQQKLCINKCKEEFKIQFFEVLEIIVAYIKTGMSIERSFEQVMGDIELLYGIKSLIYQQIKYINISVSIDISIEEAINNLARRMEIKEISDFAELFEVSIRRDGNIVNVIESMCNYVKYEMEINRQIRLSINGVLQEISIMKIMPVAILIYLRIFSRDYIEGIYNNAMGLVVMFIILIVYVVTIYVIDRMKQKILIWEY